MKRMVVLVFLIIFVYANSAYAAAANPRAMKARKEQHAKMQAYKRARAEGRLRSQPLNLPPEKKELLFKAFSISSSSWSNISDHRIKVLVVEHFIDGYKTKGITISKSAGKYVSSINGLVAQRPDLETKPFEKVLRHVAIVEYDFDNGQDKDAMAKEILGEAIFLKNKQRLGLS